MIHQSYVRKVMPFQEEASLKVSGSNHGATEDLFSHDNSVQKELVRQSKLDFGTLRSVVY